tara:strand:- start:308 stop:490 length:183 start_codon:yes stop_codon:yes gene_type:complete
MITFLKTILGINKLTKDIKSCSEEVSKLYLRMNIDYAETNKELEKIKMNLKQKYEEEKKD